MQLRTAVYTALCLIALCLFVAGTMTSIAKKTGAYSTLWESCTGTKCSALDLGSCTAAVDSVLGCRAVCCLACIFAFLGLVSGFVETCRPDTVLFLQNTILSIFACLFSAIGFSTGIVLYKVDLCEKKKSIESSGYDMGAMVWLFVAGFVVALAAVLVELLGPKGRLDYEREERLESERRQREAEAERERAEEEMQFQKERAAKAALRNLAEQQQQQDQARARLPPVAPTPRSASAAVGAGQRVQLPTAAPAGSAASLQRGKSVPAPPSSGATPRSGAGTPRMTAPPVPARLRPAGEVSPVRSPINRQAPRVQSPSVQQQLQFPAAAGIGVDGEEWEYDERAGMFWSASHGLWFDDETGRFVDPDSGMSYDPDTGEWQ